MWPGRSVRSGETGPKGVCQKREMGWGVLDDPVEPPEHPCPGKDSSGRGSGGECSGRITRWGMEMGSRNAPWRERNEMEGTRECFIYFSSPTPLSGYNTLTEKVREK